MHYSDLNGAPDQATFSGPSITAGKNYDNGFWAEDQLTVSRVTLSLGARYDHMKGVSPDMPTYDVNLHQTGGTVKGLGTLLTQNVWAPRLGGNVRLTDDGKLTMRFSAGRSYAGISNGDLGQVYPGKAKTTLYRFNPATQSYSTLVSTTDPIAAASLKAGMTMLTAAGSAIAMEIG